MAEFSNIIQYSTHSGQSIEKGGIVVTPISGALRLNLPFYSFVWSRPVAVIIEEGESSEKLPIVDVTLLMQVGLFGIGLTATILSILVTRASNRRKP